ncbi:hypothetical protein M0804_003072 [Polistes exclamans]|nr:hypothetical protein M0804_003072 [Polistes exclamans]
MPTYHNAGGGYPNVSAPARQAKLDGNQNHHTIPSNVTSHPLIQNTTSHIAPPNLSASNIPSHPVSPTMTTHSSVTSSNLTSHLNTASSPVLLTSNVTNPGNTTVLSANPRHEAWDLQPEKRPTFHDIKVTLGQLKAEYTKGVN